MKTRTVKPCGFLTTHSDESYFLIHPYPVVKDSWQGDNVYRFVCVPIGEYVYFGEQKIFNYARHIVTNSFAIEYIADMREIEIKVLDEIDVTETELHDVSDEEVSNILEEEDHGI